VAVIVSAFLPASAHQNPANCTGNNLELRLLKNKTEIVNGETVHYTVNVRNDALGACDIDNATVKFTCPAPDGTPTGAATVCATGASYLAGFPPTTTCEVDCVVTVNPGVVSAQAKAEVHGTLHFNPANDFDTADVLKFSSVRVLFCGDGVVNVPGETCDPPGSPAGGNGNTCRDNCTVCGDGHVDAGEQCDDGNNVDTDSCRNDCTPTQSEAICRTPGFWGTQAGVEKTRSQNVTEAVIDCADGNCADHTVNDYLLICGEKIGNPDSNPADGTTDWNDASSSTEALCVRVQGASILQLARQLTAGALNCIMSNGDEACASTPSYATVFATCNATCTDPAATKAQITACIGELDCLNNGGTFDGGLCTPGGPGNCHERLLNNNALDLHFEPPGPAGSSDACNAATDSKCTVVGPGEAQCGTDSLPL
jgi:cysteine-rich repeat protein